MRLREEDIDGAVECVLEFARDGEGFAERKLHAMMHWAITGADTSGGEWWITPKVRLILARMHDKLSYGESLFPSSPGNSRGLQDLLRDISITIGIQIIRAKEREGDKELPVLEAADRYKKRNKEFEEMSSGRLKNIYYETQKDRTTFELLVPLLGTPQPEGLIKI